MVALHSREGDSASSHAPHSVHQLQELEAYVLSVHTLVRATLGKCHGSVRQQLHHLSLLIHEGHSHVVQDGGKRDVVHFWADVDIDPLPYRYPDIF